MNRLLARILVFSLSGGVLLSLPTRACVWDSDTLAMERAKSPQLAQVILGEAAPAPDTAKLGERITGLLAQRRENDPDWWNDLAGAHLRLGEPQQTVELLEPVIQRFPNDYGMHANLGTAYHLLGRFREAEREIARDLEINPDAHFGLERYHLALLQYLVRDRDYQSRHVYVDEWSHWLLNTLPGYPPLTPLPGRLTPGDPWRGIDRTRQEWMLRWVKVVIPDPIQSPDAPRVDLRGRTLGAFHQEVTRDLARAGALPEGERDETLVRSIEARMSAKPIEVQMLLDRPPSYRYQWDLAADSRFEEGVVYLASLNPQQPACFTMLGVAALKRRDLNLAVQAFERSIQLGSPQSQLLQEWVLALKDHIQNAQKHKRPQPPRKPFGPTLAAIAAVCAAGLVGIRLYFRRRLQRI